MIYENIYGFITEANDLDARNQAVDIEKIVREKAKIYNESYNANIKEDVIASIAGKS